MVNPEFLGGSEATQPAAVEREPLPLPSCGSNDATDRRILAFLASVRPLIGSGSGDEAFYRGRSIIERMAMSAEGDGEPTIRLSPMHCADVLKYLAGVEPFEPQTWWRDPPDSPSHLVGFQFVLQTLATNLAPEVQI